MTNEDKSKELMAEINKLRAKDTKFSPEQDSGYYIPFDCERQTWQGNSSDKRRFLSGLCFRTEAQADYHCDMMQLAYEIKKFAFDPDWDDVEQVKIVPCFMHEDVEIIWISYRNLEISTIVFESQEKFNSAFEGVYLSDFLYMQRAGLI